MRKCIQSICFDKQRFTIDAVKQFCINNNLRVNITTTPKWIASKQMSASNFDDAQSTYIYPYIKIIYGFYSTL